MPRLFVANLTFETELAGERQHLPGRLRKLCAELASLWLGAADEGDWLWCSEPIEAAFWESMLQLGLPVVHPCGPATGPPRDLKLTPWGWSPAIREFGARVGARLNAPPDRVIRDVNSRAYSFQLEQEWECGPEIAGAVSSVADLELMLSRFGPQERWMLKARFSAAARDRLIGRGPLPDAAGSDWIRRRLSRGESLYFEQWLERVDEAGIQWDVPASGEPQLVGVTPLLCDEAGRYLGSGFGSDSELPGQWQEAVEVSRRAAVRIQQAGYFGALGIDAMRYRDADGEVRLRPLQDINARWTMGRTALGWRRIVADGVWRHGSRAEFGNAMRLPATIPTSPARVGDRPVQHCTWIEPHAGHSPSPSCRGSHHEA